MKKNSHKGMTSQIAHFLPHNQSQALTKNEARLSSSIVEM
jgi:hypothetical protein